MSKITQYFNSVEELNAYYQSGVPSGVLAIVQGGPDETAVLYTSGNNSPYNPGQKEDMGGYVMPPEDAALIEEMELEIYQSEEFTNYITGPDSPPAPDWDQEIWDNMPEYDEEDIQYNMSGEVFQECLENGSIYYEFIGYEDFPYQVEPTSPNSCDIMGNIANPEVLVAGRLPAETGIRVYGILDGLKYYLSWTNTATYDERGGYQITVCWDDDNVSSGENDTSEYIGIEGDEDEELWLYNCGFDGGSFSTESNVETGDLVISVGNFNLWMPIPAGWNEEEEE